MYFVKESMDLLVLLLYVYTMEYYSAIKKNEIMPYAAMWMDLTIAIFSEVRQRRRNIVWHLIHVESKKKCGK